MKKILVCTLLGCSILNADVIEYGHLPITNIVTKTYTVNCTEPEISTIEGFTLETANSISTSEWGFTWDDSKRMYTKTYFIPIHVEGLDGISHELHTHPGYNRVKYEVWGEKYIRRSGTYQTNASGETVFIPDDEPAVEIYRCPRWNEIGTSEECCILG